MSANYKHPSCKPVKSRFNGSLARLGGRVAALAAAVLLATSTAAFATPGDGFDVRGEGGAARQEAPEAMRQGVPDAYSNVRSVALPQGGGVYLFAEPGSIPEGVALRVRKITESEDAFAQAQQRVRDAGVLYDHFTALDISLVDESGSEVEPESQVYVSIDGRELTPVDPEQGSIQIQHHKELNASVRSAEPDGAEQSVELETVLDGETGTLNQNGPAGSWVATFPVDGFSVYTITSAGWKDLNIQIECVDEEDKGLVAEHKPNNVKYDERFTQNEKFTIDLTLKEHTSIDNAKYKYEYGGKTYYMKGGEYQVQIYGLRREGGAWYYFTKPLQSNEQWVNENKIKFNPQPDFYGPNPNDAIRSLYRKVMEIPVKYMDDAGGMENGEIVIAPQEAPNKKNPDTITYHGTTLILRNADQMPKSDAYFYTGLAYIGEPKPENEVRRVVREGGVAHAIRVGGDEKVALSDENPLKLLYHRTVKKPGLLETVSTKDKGMQINLFAYKTGSWQAEEGINRGKQLKFIGGTTTGDEPYNKWTGKDGGLYTGIVERNLGEDGFPVMAHGEHQSLNYLFDKKMTESQIGNTVEHVHTDLDHLFWRDQRGYYHYDSMTSFATIMDPDKEGNIAHQPGHTKGGNFAVYKQPARPGKPATGDEPKFLPFNTYQEANESPANSAENERTKRFHFGMTIATDFNMPIGGVVSDGMGGLTDMIFEFNGDDDVWVFIDGKLALDLGGIHDRYGGTINFKTGEVTTNAPYSAHSGRYQGNIYGIPKGTVDGMNDAELDKVREEKGFGKLSTHNLKFFYLERGRGASNCEIRFNLVPVEHGLIVGKRVPQKFDDVVDDHTWYKFQARAVHPDGYAHPLANATYKVLGWDRNETDPINGAKPIRTDSSDKDGYFWLRPGERADFSGAINLEKAGVTGTDKVVQINVSEVVPDGERPSSVKAWTGGGEQEGSYLKVTDTNGKERHLTPPLYDIQESSTHGGKYVFHPEKEAMHVLPAPAPNAGEVAYPVTTTTGRNNQFNWIDFENDLSDPSILTVTKNARWAPSDGSEGKPITGQPFQVKIELWDERTNSWAPMEVGSHYWILDEKDSAPAVGGAPEEMTKEQDGQIPLKHGQKIYVKLMPGTKYRVMELLSDLDKPVYTTTYTGTVDNNQEGSAGEFEILKDDQQQGRQEGIGNVNAMISGRRHDVVITNERKPLPANALKITKRVERSDGQLSDGEFTFQVTLKGPDVFNPKEVKSETIDEGGVVVPKPELVFTKKGEDYTAELRLKHGQTVSITGLPSETKVEVRETSHEGYTVSMNQKPGDTTEVYLTPDNSNPHVIECLNKTGALLPATGSVGVLPWYFAGAALMGAAAWLLHRQRGKQGVR